MLYNFWHTSLAAAILTLTVGAATATATAQELTWAECPPVVQAAIRDHSQGGQLEEIKLVRKEAGTFYVAEVGLGEKRDLKLHITPEGAVVKARQEITFNQAPAPVRRTVLGLLQPGAAVSDVDMETAEGVTTFVVEIKVSENRELKLTLQPDGNVLSEHVEEKK